MNSQYIAGAKGFTDNKNNPPNIYPAGCHISQEFIDMYGLDELNALEKNGNLVKMIPRPSMSAIDAIQACQGFIDDAQNSVNSIKDDDKAKQSALTDYLAENNQVGSIIINSISAEAFYLGNKNAIDQIKKQLDEFAQSVPVEGE